MNDLAPGTVTLVGGGPGDPDLITVAGLKAVQQADVVLHDRLSPAEVLDEAPDGCELVDVGKIPGGKQTPQDEINRLLIEHARAGRRVVRLKGGDSFVFGRGGEEWLACAEAGVPVRVIPGVSSAIAGPALAGIPVTHRTLTQGVTIVAGHVPPGDPRSQLDWSALANTRTTLVILMGVAHLPEIAAALQDGGLVGETPAAIVANASTPQARTLHGTLATIAPLAREAAIAPPAITVIGDVAGLDLTNS
ncbi:MAG: uroporphyrinogen-III C-methyltransferase [Dermatophilus congolensis]|nr:uroporphyrinogen-III C-methyltransferase [Dermatophilus congolensis]